MRGRLVGVCIALAVDTWPIVGVGAYLGSGEST